MAGNIQISISRKRSRDKIWKKKKDVNNEIWFKVDFEEKTRFKMAAKTIFATSPRFVYLC